MPDASLRIKLALSISLWLIISASAGTSLKVGRNIFEKYILHLNNVLLYKIKIRPKTGTDHTFRGTTHIG
jgi:membrane-anchored protein YejM (alkaline phosphatase superfamily)